MKPMMLYPAIDLMANQCVRLRQGNFTNATYYNRDACTVAKQYQQQGAKRLHVVDLDGARIGKPQQTELIQALAKQTKLKIQVGGGLREEPDICNLLNKGIDRVVLGSLAIREPERVQSWLRRYGAERFVLALDIQIIEGQPHLVEQGWQQTSSTTLSDILSAYQAFAPLSILCTDISVDGTLTGPNFSLYAACQQNYPDIHWLASGGVATLQDVQALAAQKLAGVVIGKALYENRFSLSEALQAVCPC